MGKSSEAFRTISEIAAWLDTPAYVLRFWESKFRYIRPVKRSGNRRYYRPRDAYLVAGIKKLLHVDGQTIKAVQLLLKKEGVKYVGAIGKSYYKPLGAQADEVEKGLLAKEHIEAEGQEKNQTKTTAQSSKSTELEVALPDGSVPTRPIEIPAPTLPTYETLFPPQEQPLSTKLSSTKPLSDKASEVVAISIPSKETMPEQLDMFSVVGFSDFGGQKKSIFEQEPKIDLAPPASFLLSQLDAETSPDQPPIDKIEAIEAALIKLRALRARFANRLE